MSLTQIHHLRAALLKLDELETILDELPHDDTLYGALRRMRNRTQDKLRAVEAEYVYQQYIEPLENAV